MTAHAIMPLRVVTVTTFFPNAAFPQRAVFVKNLVRALQRHCEVEVISPVPWLPAVGGKPEWNVYREIPRCTNANGIAVEHPRYLVLPRLGWLTGVGFFLGVFRALRRFRPVRDRIVVHAHCAYPDAVGVALAAKLLGLRYVVTAHGSDINVYSEQAALRPQIRWALRHAAGVVAVSAALQEKVRCLIGRPDPEVACIPCAAFDPEVFAPRSRDDMRRRLDMPAQGRIVVFVGLLVPIKGLEYLVAAWIALASRGVLDDSDRLVLLGDGPCRAALRQQIEQAGLGDRVLFAGTVNQDAVARGISAATLLCLPSRNEGMPNVVVEALACGVPVVASRVGGIPELVRDDENGYLVPPADPTALADALGRAMEREWDPQAIAAGVANRTWRAIASRNFEFLQERLKDHDAIA
jgi:teichuronic acid biosynthesis glycosyltransferase TuaC